jgi:hypothetical protein
MSMRKNFHEPSRMKFQLEMESEDILSTLIITIEESSLDFCAHDRVYGFKFSDAVAEYN